MIKGSKLVHTNRKTCFVVDQARLLETELYCSPEEKQQQQSLYQLSSCSVQFPLYT